MNIFRAIFLFLTLFTLTIPPVIAQPSGRKIDGVENGGPQSEAMISRDGRFLAFLSLPGEKGSDCIVFDRLTHRSTMLPGSGRMEPLCFSRDGRGLWVWGLWVDGSTPGLNLKQEMKPFIALYDLRRQRYIRKVTGLDEDSDVPDGSAMSSDGRTFVFRTQSGQIYRFSTRTGRLLWNHPEPKDCSTIYAADGRKSLRMYSDDNEKISRIEIVSARSGQALRKLRLPFSAASEADGYVSLPRIAPSGPQVAVYKPSSMQWIFMDSRTSRVQWQIKNPPSDRLDGDIIWNWSPDASLVAIDSPKNFELREARTGRILLRSSRFNGFWSVFSPDNSILYTFKNGDIDFGAYTTVWQWRLFPTRSQRRADASYMRNLRLREERFALSKAHLSESLSLAANNGEVKRVELLLNRGANIETIDRNHESPLMTSLSGIPLSLASNRPAGDKVETAKLLIKRGANVKKFSGELLASAIDYGEPITKMLLDHGANVNGSAEIHVGYGTALHTATHQRYLGMTQLLLEHGANPNLGDEEGKTPMMDLVENLEAGPPPPKVVFQIGQLLIDHGANVNAHDKEGKTALSMCKNKSFKEFLRKAGAKAN